MKYAKLLIRRQDNENKILQYTSLFDTLHCIELIEVDKIEACCIGIKTGCTFRRSKDKLPDFIEGSMGPIIRSVTTIDQSQRVTPTFPSTYANMTKRSSFRYNKEKYYWYLDGYIYIPDVEWESIRMEAMFDEDVSVYNCSTANEKAACISQQSRTLDIPEYLFAEIEQMVLQELLPTIQVPSDGADDAQNVLR